jgi:hypothetical protein
MAKPLHEVLLGVARLDRDASKILASKGLIEFSKIERR